MTYDICYYYYFIIIYLLAVALRVGSREYCSFHEVGDDDDVKHSITVIKYRRYKSLSSFWAM